MSYKLELVTENNFSEIKESSSNAVGLLELEAKSAEVVFQVKDRFAKKLITSSSKEDPPLEIELLSEKFIL